MPTSEEMASMFSGDPGFFDFLKSVGTKVLRGAVKSIPFVGGIVSEFVDPAINAIVGEPEEEHYDDSYEEDEEF